MAGKKFSEFDSGLAMSGNSFVVGYDTTADTNNRWTLAELATGLSPSIATIYSGDGTIAASRVLTISDFPKFSGTLAGQIGLEIENTQSGADHTVCGAQIKLTSNADTGTISQFDSTGGGSTAPTMKLESPTGINYVAGAFYGQGYHYFQTGGGGAVAFDRDGNNGIVKYIIAGGGGTNTEVRYAQSGSNYSYLNCAHSTATKAFAWGFEATGNTELMRMTRSAQLGINSDGLTIAETLHVNGNTRVEGQSYSPIFTITYADPPVIDWDNGSIQTITLTGSPATAIAAPSNPKDGATYILIVKQDATGGRTFAGGWNAVFKWKGGTAPTLSAGANAVDIITFVCDGTNYYGVDSLNFS